MTDESAIAVPPPLVLRGRGTRVQLDRQGVLLDRQGARTTIPPAAVERVQAAGLGGRTLRIVLTSPSGDGGRTYSVRCRSAAAVRAFAAGFEAALPLRDREARRIDGRSLVHTAPVPMAGWRPISRTARITWASVALYAAGLTYIVAAAREPAFLVVLWTIAPMALAPSLICLEAIGGFALECWGLWVRGVTVVADLTDTRRGTQGSIRYTYRYRDADGVQRIHASNDAPWPADSKAAELTYDAAHPNRIRVRKSRRHAVMLGTFVSLGLAVFGGMAVLGLCCAVFALVGPLL
ncbi:MULTISPECIES: hypothetical protein [Streptomyces]|uniref:hypothetical protein n=1 Tax=Streptomyces TaxID=1883 RepID=UPI00163BAFDE|nr:MULTISPECIES: hypothetical protein [Streptomyces]MBC2878491.1 hypothetical protein [Streptomyces sp. TYQ1024]UBI38820.1 hypothetical protein K7I03_21765 [Streptomyces mobaraensis]UKW31400.1 hypothetical protein MCU78_21710 [Streptomyces sp. TYQ1024]